MGCLGKSFALVLVVIFLLSLVTFSSNTVKASPKTITVPTDYPTIQEAIGNASAGDTVFVKEGTYNQPITIDKPLSLIGEDNQKTVISEEGAVTVLNHVTISIAASDVYLSGFMIKDCNRAISQFSASNQDDVKITGNRIVNNSIGILLNEDNRNWAISDNDFENNTFEGIMFSESTNLTIAENTFSGNYAAIQANGGEMVIKNNQIVGNSYGISLNDISRAMIFANFIINNSKYDILGSKFNEIYGFGISFNWGCNNIQVYGNQIENNSNGIYLFNFQVTDKNGNNHQGSNNIVFQNNIAKNSNNSFIEYSYRYFSNEVKIKNGTANVSWDNSKIGNFWSDYNSNDSYVIDQNNIDHHPLTKQVDINSIAPTPTPSLTSNLMSPLTITLVAIVGVVLAIIISLLIFKRHRKSQNKPKPKA